MSIEPELNRNNISKSPIHQFEKWFKEIKESSFFTFPEAMILSTASKDGIPSARVLLLKGFDKTGFVFFTNYESRKSVELKENPIATMTFYWQKFERQVRISGNVVKLSDKRSEEYFKSRPFESKIGAWASPQSKNIRNRKELENLFKIQTKRFKDKEVPKPGFWGGYILLPTSFEFWQGRKNRLHDRMLFTLKKNGKWNLQILAP